jgi:hypothetical protein
LISTLAAMLHMSLRRSRASWPIVVSAGLICLLAASLMAAGPMYASAVSIAGLHRVLADAPPAEANVGVSLRAGPGDWVALDQVTSQELTRMLGAPGGTIHRFGRSDSFELPRVSSGPLIDLVDIGFAEGLEEHATLVEGSWPADASADGPIPVVLADTVAARIGFSVGDERTLASRIHADLSVPLRVVGVFRITDPADPYWWAERQVVDGIETSDRFATHGPLFTTRDALLGRATASQAALTWRAFPEAESLTLADIDPLQVRVAGLQDRLAASLGRASVGVETRLPEILADAQRSLLASRTGVLLLTAQFVVLAAYAVLLSAALLVEHRKMDTAMLRSRGAGPARIGVLALVEGLLLTVPAAIAGPWLAALVLRALNEIGPLADIGLRIEPVVTTEAYVASGLAAAACLVALLVPAIPRIRSFAAIHGSVGRAETRTAGQRLGIDLALLAVAGLGLWQLRLYGAPLTRTVQGTLGIDPLLVATPAIGFLAGAVLALRVVPLVASLIERLTSRRRGLVPSLGARQLSRRPLRYTRAALLLMLAMSMGVFAITYTRTWTDSQRDQAAFQVGADLRAEPGRQVADLPVWALDRAYAATTGIRERMPVGTTPIRVPRSEASGELVAVDTSTAGAVVEVRPDLVERPLSDLMAPLAAARPRIDPTPLPGEPRRLRFDVTFAIDELRAPVVDEETGEVVDEPLDPAVLEGRSVLSTSVVVLDAAGQLYRFPGVQTPFAPGPHTVEVPLGVGDRADASFAYPLRLMALEVGLFLPQSTEATIATVALGGVEASPSPAGTPGEGWVPVPLELDQGWRLGASIYGSPHQRVGDRVTGGTLAVEVPADGLPTVAGVDQFQRGTVLTFAPADLDRVAAEPLPVIATDAYLEATAGIVGDVVPVGIAGVDREVRIVGSVRAFPTVDPDSPALIADLESIALLRFEGSHGVDPPRQWWFAVEDGGAEAVVERLRDPAVGSASVVSRTERAEALATDPVALGVIGALGIGVAAAAAFAIVGFIVSAAVSARERVTEFALLRALGLSSGQLSGWLSLENATLAVISLFAGTALGLLIAWVALPFLTVTQSAATAFPPVEVAVPWTTIGLLEVIGIVALAGAIVGLTWSLGRTGMASALRMGED